MFYGIIAVVLVLCVLLILIIMVQNPKGGLSGDFGGAASQMMGAQKSTDLLEKINFWVYVRNSGTCYLRKC